MGRLLSVTGVHAEVKGAASRINRDRQDIKATIDTIGLASLRKMTADAANHRSACAVNRFDSVAGVAGS